MYPFPFCNFLFCDPFTLPRKRFLMCVITAKVNVCQSDVVSYVNSVDILFSDRIAFTRFLTYKAPVDIDTIYCWCIPFLELPSTTPSLMTSTSHSLK
jgi:hypothetical protein